MNDRVRMHRGLCLWKYEHLLEFVNTFVMKSGVEKQRVRRFGPGSFHRNKMIMYNLIS